MKETKKARRARIQKMVATKKRMREEKMRAQKEVVLNLPGMVRKPAMRMESERAAKPSENLSVLYARLEQHFSPAEKKEMEEAIRTLKLLEMILEIRR